MGYAKEWLGLLKNQKYSKKSLDTYQKALQRFDEFLLLTSISRVQDVTAEHLSHYRLYLVGRGLSDATIYVYLRSVRMLFKYLEDNQQVFINPAASMVLPRCERKLQGVPCEEAIKRLLLQPNTGTAVGVRDRALLETAYSTGVRRGELCALTVFDPDVKQGTLRVMGKGRKERVVPLGKHAVLWLKQYMENARAKLTKNPDEVSLWITKTGTKLSYARIDKLIREYAAAAGLSRVSPHTLRRACATHMLRNGAPPVKIQMLLGHANLKSLSQYLRVTITDMKKMHQKSKPGR